jgi:hypothetical protein
MDSQVKESRFTESIIDRFAIQIELAYENYTSLAS